MNWLKKFMVYRAYRTGWKNGYQRGQMDIQVARGGEGVKPGRYDG